jgi:hypothetical protein
MQGTLRRPLCPQRAPDSGECEHDSRNDCKRENSDGKFDSETCEATKSDITRHNSNGCGPEHPSKHAPAALCEGVANRDAPEWVYQIASGPLEAD